MPFSVVNGSAVSAKRRTRSITDSSVAIDVISPEQISTTGYADVNDALRTLVPAFNAQRLQGNDGSSFVRRIVLAGAFAVAAGALVAVAGPERGAAPGDSRHMRTMLS